MPFIRCIFTALPETTTFKYGEDLPVEDAQRYIACAIRACHMKFGLPQSSPPGPFFAKKLSP